MSRADSRPPRMGPGQGTNRPQISGVEELGVLGLGEREPRYVVLEFQTSDPRFSRVGASGTDGFLSRIFPNRGYVVRGGASGKDGYRHLSSPNSALTVGGSNLQTCRICSHSFLTRDRKPEICAGPGASNFGNSRVPKPRFGCLGPLAEVILNRQNSAVLGQVWKSISSEV